MTTDSFSRVAKNWESLAKSDPMWAILSDPAKKGNKWEIGEFLETGVREIEQQMKYLEQNYSFKDRATALDFGCGIGRLTLPLANYFDSVFGVDISDRMIHIADQLKENRRNTYKGQITYILNKSNSIPFQENKFDLIYSRIVLQHLNKYNALLYISEFMRVLKRGGFAMFQAPSRCLTAEGVKFESPVETGDGIVTIDMNTLPIGFVVNTIYDAGGKVVEIKEDHSSGPNFESFTYIVSR